MNILGIGGFELLLIMAVGLFVVGPKRLRDGIREARGLYRELKRQRQELQTLLEQAIELEEMKKQLDVERFAEGAREIAANLSLDPTPEAVPNSETGKTDNRLPAPTRRAGRRSSARKSLPTTEAQA